MRVYLSVDMEGVAGVVHEDQTNPVEARCAGEYARFRRLMTLEANAAITGALAGGATEVVVNDSHWTMRNLLAEELHPTATLISGGPKTWSMMEGIQAGADLAACIGYHARAGTPAAILDHTYTGRISDVRVNGRSVGELGLNAMLAGSFGVPVAMVSGDAALAREAHALLGDGVRAVVVKDAVSRHAARSVAPDTAQAMIHDAMREVVEAFRRGPPLAVRPLTPGSPVMLEVEFTATVHADHAAMLPGSERADGRTVRYAHAEYREAFRAFRTIFNLWGMD
jgi:D-amino peptidase